MIRVCIPHLYYWMRDSKMGWHLSASLAAMFTSIGLVGAIYAGLYVFFDWWHPSAIAGAIGGTITAFLWNVYSGYKQVKKEEKDAEL